MSKRHRYRPQKPKQKWYKDDFGSEKTFKDPKKKSRKDEKKRAIEEGYYYG